MILKTVAIIPARFRSTRFPGKPLAEINGKPMVWHVVEAARKVSTINEVYVATDDERIKSACAGLGIASLMTRDDHLTGTDRLAECISQVDADFYVNVQGDEPMIDPEAIARVTHAMQKNTDGSIVATNGYSLIDEAADVANTNIVKVTTTVSGKALSFSRAPIPFPRSDAPRYKRQLGLYCFSRRALSRFADLPPGPVERSESVEMLRFVENDLAVLMVEVEDRSVAVDTPDDLHRVRGLMAG